MNTDNRPNIITIGILANAFAALTAWIWNAFGPLPMGPAEQGALSILMTGGAQYLDRVSKRANQHVLRKHGTPPQDDQ